MYYVYQNNCRVSIQKQKILKLSLTTKKVKVNDITKRGHQKLTNLFLPKFYIVLVSASKCMRKINLLHCFV